MQQQLEKLRLRLLDLTGRNRLLNFKHTPGRALPMLACDGGAIYRRLVEQEAALLLEPLPEPGGTDLIVKAGRRQRPDESSWARRCGWPTTFLNESEVAASAEKLRLLHYADHAAKHCRKLQREARSAIEETGANMLYLAVGFVAMPEPNGGGFVPRATTSVATAEPTVTAATPAIVDSAASVEADGAEEASNKTWLAPLLCLPVQLEIALLDGVEHFRLSWTKEEPEENLSLREKLRTDFGLVLPEWPSEADAVPAYFDEVAVVLAAKPGFALQRRSSLCLLSFTNMLLVRDLDPARWPKVAAMEKGRALQSALLTHPLVQTILSGVTWRADGDEGNVDADVGQARRDNVDVVAESDAGNAAGTNGTVDDAARYAELEQGLSDDLPLVYDADSSQHVALNTVLLHGKNTVIQGPPGTGKSQTITNLIAAAMYQGKRVLFVAEKLAALQVVQGRLARVGLAPFVLELHSTRSNRKAVIDSLVERVAFRQPERQDLPLKLTQLRRLRAQLNAYVQSMHQVRGNALGLTLQQVLWRGERHRLAATVAGAGPLELSLRNADIDDAPSLGAEALNQRLESLAGLAATYRRVLPRDGAMLSEAMWWGWILVPLLPHDADALVDALTRARPDAQKFLQRAEAYEAFAGEATAGFDSERLPAQVSFATRWLGWLERLPATAESDVSAAELGPLLARDPAGERLAAVIEVIASARLRYDALDTEVRAALIEERLPPATTIARLRETIADAEGLGWALGEADDVASARTAIEAHLDRLRDGLARAKALIAADFPNVVAQQIHSWQMLHQVVKLAGELSLADELSQSVAHPRALAAQDALGRLDTLYGLQSSWWQSAQALGKHLHLDALPNIDVVRNAVMTLRAGDGWYRVLQPSWWRVRAIHRQMNKRASASGYVERLADLEALLKMQTQQAAAATAKDWALLVGKAPSAEPISLVSERRFASWIADVRAAQREVAVTAIDFARVDWVERITHDAPLWRTLHTAFEQAVGACAALAEKLPEIAKSEVYADVPSMIEGVTALLPRLDEAAALLRSEGRAGATAQAVLTAMSACAEREQIRVALKGNREAQITLGQVYRGIETSLVSVQDMAALLQEFRGLRMPREVNSKVFGAESVAALSAKISQFKKLAADLRESLFWRDALPQSMARFGRLDTAAWGGFEESTSVSAQAKLLLDSFERCIEGKQAALDYALLTGRCEALGAQGLRRYVDALCAGYVGANALVDAYAYAVYATVARRVLGDAPELVNYSGLDFDALRANFAQLDREIQALRSQHVAAHAHATAQPPTGNSGQRVDELTEMQLLRHVMPQQRPRVTLRNLMSRAGNAVQSLKPCLMMGPQAVAQFLPPHLMKFDLVVMDEASQLPPERALGAIARATQLVVVGDSKQLPPTNFFSRQVPDGDDNTEFAGVDAESVLDVCALRFHSQVMLQWHYRSRHESLIAFSNQQFYAGKLLVFPSPYSQSTSLGVRGIYVQHASYEDQRNVVEAEQVVAAAIAHMLDSPTLSLGIVSLNLKQRDLVEDLLEPAIRDNAKVEAFLAHWKNVGEPFFVKNLENVQGDERDSIIISTTFGRGQNVDRVRQNFGPISQQGGWRRLNVLFTRARNAVLVVTSMRPEDIVVGGNTPAGTKALRDYLRFVQYGRVDDGAPSLLDAESDFEIAVMQGLRSRGFECVAQLGVAGFRIDIAVNHPDHEGVFLAAVECDGAAYHSAKCARDRDRIRQEIIESLGWKGKIWRIWSTDWFRSPDAELDRLVVFLQALLAQSTPQHAPVSRWTEADLQQM